MSNKNDDVKILKILHFEDSYRDAEIVKESLIDAGLSMQIDLANNEQEFTDFLRNGRYDVILADYQLFGFDALAALRLTKSLCPGIPFICISGVIGEEKAMALLKEGAADYVSKNRLYKLPQAIQQALDEIGELGKHK